MAPLGPLLFGGALHGVTLAGVHLFRRLRIKIPQWLGVALTFCLVTFAWVYFRAADMATANNVVAGPFKAPWPIRRISPRRICLN